MNPWKRVEPTIVTKVGYRTVTIKHFELPSGLVVDRGVLHEDGWAAACALALTTNNKVIVARQFRPGPEKVFEDIPGGILDKKGESPEDCIVRELAEETGYKPGKVEYLGEYYYDSYVNGKRHYFLMTDCQPTGTDQQMDVDEDIEVELITIDQLIDNARQARMLDPGVVFLAWDKLQALKKEGKHD